MKNSRIILMCALMLFVLSANSQEYLTGFGTSSPSKDYQPRVEWNDNVTTIPFFDDFTDMSSYPSDSRWQNRCVFVNDGFPFKPVNYRAATLDVLDQYGSVYSNASSTPFVGDSLMSVAIRLDSLNGKKLTPADSLYLSFYYQPGGFANCPDKYDSLVLCFGYGHEIIEYDSVYGNVTITEEIEWKHVWSTPGFSFDSTFRKVMIPIKDTCFFKEKFYILFYNYATLPTIVYANERSNMDVWNIDCVYLNANRTVNPYIKEDSYPKVGLTGKPAMFLKRYSSMPYRQYKETSPVATMNAVYSAAATNLDSMTHNVRYTCYVEDNNSGNKFDVSDTTFLLSEYEVSEAMDLRLSMNKFRFPDNLQGDSATFTIRQYIDVVDDYGATVAGDSIVSIQKFGKYYAYDDGIPESGYGLMPDDTYFATQFSVSNPDTLYGVQFVFNETYNSANYNFFDVYVWGNNDGKPGDVIYTLKNQRPEWTDKMYEYVLYEFEEPVPVSGLFYVGIRQTEKKSINIGFDRSVDNSKYNFFKVDANWKNSEFAGSLMIRPYIGNENYKKPVVTNEEKNDMRVFPNPASDILRIGLMGDEKFERLMIYDVTGRRVMEMQYTDELTISALPNGVYLIKALRANGTYKASKFVISK